MSIPSNLFAAAFREHRLGLMFMILVMTLVYLASLAVAAQGALATASDGWSRNVQGRLTVEVPFPASGSASAQIERIKKVTATLQAMPEIDKLAPLPESEIARLLKPWFSETVLLTSLPLPTLIDIETKNAEPLSVVTLREKLSPIVNDIRVSSRAEGLDNLLRLVSGLRLLAGLMIVLTTLTLIIAIILICRAAMAVQHDTIELLHFMGATDSDIARQFLHHARRLSLPASLAGFAAAIATAVLLLYLMRSVWDQPVVFDRVLLMPGVMMALVPIAAVLVAMAAARIAVLSLLRRMP